MRNDLQEVIKSTSEIEGIIFTIQGNDPHLPSWAEKVGLDREYRIIALAVRALRGAVMVRCNQNNAYENLKTHARRLLCAGTAIEGARDTVGLASEVSKQGLDHDISSGE